MDGLLLALGVVGIVLLFAGGIILLGILGTQILTPCYHSYERVDTCNDKKMVLVCRKCGKIKKLRK